jgi:hypothetical protein
VTQYEEIIIEKIYMVIFINPLLIVLLYLKGEKDESYKERERAYKPSVSTFSAFLGRWRPWVPGKESRAVVSE